MRLPEVRAELLKVGEILIWAGQQELGERIVYLARQTRRRSPIRRAPIRRGSVTPEQARAYLSIRPDADNVEIANAFNCNPGRVSEALAGERT